MKNKKLFILFAALMVVLGTSDALRGIFSPLFLSSFSFTEAQIGVIVSASYFGNLIFLLLGGSILDKIGLKKSMIAFSILMMLSLIMLVFGYIYAILLVGFFLSLGLSTLLNTCINIASDSFSATKSLVYLNVLFFIQGLGTSGSQLFLSPFSLSERAWNLTLTVLSVSLIAIILLLWKCPIEEKKEKEMKTSKKGKIEYAPLLLLILTLSFYTIAEHGVTNYIISYGMKSGLTSSNMGTFLALFSLGIMTGRLILGSLIGKIGEMKMVAISLLIGTILFFLIFSLSLFALTFVLGFSISTLYPTLVALSRRFVSSSYSSRVTTITVSLASVFDIIFNFTFGFAIESFGFKESMMALPFSMLLSLIFGLILTSKAKKIIA